MLRRRWLEWRYRRAYRRWLRRGRPLEVLTDTPFHRKLDALGEVCDRESWPR